MGSGTATETPATGEPRDLPDPSARASGLWSIRRAGPFAPVSMALLRLRRAVSLLLPVFLGVLVAATLLAAVPLYSTLVSNVQLQAVLGAQPQPNLNLETVTTLISVQASDADQIDQVVKPLVSSQLSGFAPISMSYLDSKNLLFVSINGKPPAQAGVHSATDLATSVARPMAFDYAQTGPHMRLFAGRLPQDTPPGQVPEVLATTKLGARVGDVISFQQIGAAGVYSRVRVVGIWYPNDASDPYWNGHSFDTVDLCVESRAGCPPPVYPILFTRDGFFSALSSFTAQASVLPSFSTPPFAISQHYVAFTDPTRITAQNTASILSHIAAFHARLNGTLPALSGVPFAGLVVDTELGGLLLTLERQLSLLAQPLYVVVAQLAGLALLFIVTVGALLIEERSGEIVTLKSRGASRTQLVLNFALLAIVPAALAAACGVILASLLAVRLVLLIEPSSARANPAYLQAQANPRMALFPVVAAAILGVLAVGFAAWQVTRNDIVAFRREQGRGGGRPFWRRYYLDVALAVICLAGYLELGRFGGLSIRDQLNQGPAATAGADPLQVVAPALLLLSGALLVLRILGPAARLCARVASRGRGATRMLAFTQASRISGQFARLTLLLTLAVGLSFFALSFQSALGRNAAERAAYTAGGDVRMQLDPNFQFTQYGGTLPATLIHLPGVTRVTPVVRLLTKTTQDQGTRTTGMLGIDPATFAQVAYWRDDYANQSLSTLLDQLRHHTIATGAGESDHPLWAMVSDTFASNLGLMVGSRFALTLQLGIQGDVVMQVGAILHDFPTMFNTFEAGYVVVSEPDLLVAMGNSQIANLPGSAPNEFWLRTTGTPGDDAARAAAIQRMNLSPVLSTILDRRTLATEYLADPVTAGMGGLLLAGAALAVILTALASLLQARASARQRLTQFAVMRTLGMTRDQIRDLLLSEHILAYLFGLVAGTALGLLLTTATLPFLGYSSALQNPATVGVPPYVIAFNPLALVAFYAMLVLIFGTALLLEARLAARAGLGQALRIGED